MKSLITGIGGFVGSHLAEHLLECGHEVAGLIQPGRQSDNVEPIRARISLFEGDILDAGRMSDLIQKMAPDRIFHLAAQSAVPASWSDPAQTFQVNTVGSIRILEAALPLKETVRVVVVGSAEIYGKGDSTGTLREDSPLAPQNPYAASKLALDLVADQIACSRGLHLVRMRPMNHAGPRQEPMFVFSDFAKQVAEIEAGQRPPVIRVGNLDSRRDFTDVRDVARAYALAAERGKSGAAYLVCSGTPRRVGDVLEYFLSQSKVPIRVEKDPEKFRPVDYSHASASAAKLEEDTGWKPEIPFQNTMSDTLVYWRARVRGSVALS